MPKKDRVTYKSSGVDIQVGKEAVDLCKNAIKESQGSDVLLGVGSFGGGILLPDGQTVLVQSIDGVGTKSGLGVSSGNCSSLGVDIVHHCVNDILTQGAIPNSFLDYFACARLSKKQMAEVVIGAANACKKLGFAMVGGETAEMPGVYIPGAIDVVGCISGLVNRHKIITGKGIQPGDILIGLGSDGFHTNGYTFVRELLGRASLSLKDEAPWKPTSTVGKEVLRPHRCYLKSIKPLLSIPVIQGMAHITGGGIPGNLTRILPSGCEARVDCSSWEKDPIFNWMQRRSGNTDAEIYKVLNMGIGMILVVRREERDFVMANLTRGNRERAFVIGEIVKGRKSVKLL